MGEPCPAPLRVAMRSPLPFPCVPDRPYKILLVQVGTLSFSHPSFGVPVLFIYLHRFDTGTKRSTADGNPLGAVEETGPPGRPLFPPPLESALNRSLVALHPPSRLGGRRDQSRATSGTSQSAKGQLAAPALSSTVGRQKNTPAWDRVSR